VWCTTVDKDLLTDSAHIRHYGYKFNKSGFDFYVMDIQKKFETKENVPPTTIVVRRSVQASSPDPAGVGDTPFLRGLVHIYGYLIEPCVGDPNSCTVFCVSQLGNFLDFSFFFFFFFFFLLLLFFFFFMNILDDHHHFLSGRGLEKLEVTWKKLSLIKQLLERVLTLFDKRDKERKAKELKAEKYFFFFFFFAPYLITNLSFFFFLFHFASQSQKSDKSEKDDKREDKKDEDGSEKLKEAGGGAVVDGGVEKDELETRERTFTFPGSRLFFGMDMKDDDKDSMSILERRRSQIGLIPSGSDDDDETHTAEEDQNENEYDDDDAPRNGSVKNQKVPRFPEVTTKNFKEVAADLTGFFIMNSEYDKEGDFGWRKIKETNGVTLSRKKADDGNHLDFIKGVVMINLSPGSVYEALRNERYFHLLHPDFLSCEQLEVLSLLLSFSLFFFLSVLNISLWLGA
jgi:hypothetical protein